MVALFVVAAVFILVNMFIGTVFNLKKFTPLEQSIMAITFAGVFLLEVWLALYWPTTMYDKGQVDALKGIQTHEIQLVYPLGDTIPSDTLYVKIKM